MTELHTTREMAENALYWNLQSYGPNCAEVWISETALQAHELKILVQSAYAIINGQALDQLPPPFKAASMNWLDAAREWMEGVSF